MRNLCKPTIVTISCVVVISCFACIMYHNGKPESLLPTNPTFEPTTDPITEPTKPPTLSPTHNPSQTPSNSPTNTPSHHPTTEPTKPPTLSPTNNPSQTPTNVPTNTPSHHPTTTIEYWCSHQSGIYNLYLLLKIYIRLTFDYTQIKNKRCTNRKSKTTSMAIQSYHMA